MHTCIIRTQTLREKLWEKLAELYNTHPFYTSLGTFKWLLDEHHPALLWHFESLALLYKILDLLTYLGTTLQRFYSVYSSVTQICYGEPPR